MKNSINNPLIPEQIKNDFETLGEILERKEAKEYIDRTTEEMKFSDSAKDYVNLFAKQQSEEINLKFAQKYFEVNKDQLVQHGVDVNMADSRKLAYFIKEGLGDEIKKETCSWCDEKDYENFLKKEELYNIRAEMEKGEMRLESPYVMLHFLENKNKEIYKDLNRVDSAGEFVLRGAERKIKEKEADDLFKTMEEVAGKVSGRDFRKESVKELEQEIVSGKIISRDKYVKYNLDQKEKELSQPEFLKKEIWGGDWDKLSEEDKVNKYGGDASKFFQEKIKEQINGIGRELIFKESDLLILIKNGYDLKKFALAGFFGGKINTGKEIIGRKEFNGFLNKQGQEFGKKLSERAAKELGEEWDAGRVEDAHLKTYDKIIDISKILENAEAGIAGYLRRLKTERVNEIILKSVKTDQKNKEKIGKIEEFLGGKNEAEDFLKKISERKDIKTLGGEFDGETLDSIKEFMESFGIETDFLNETYESSSRGDAWSAGIMENLSAGYKANVNKRKGFINWMVGLVSTLLNPPEKPKAKQQQQPGWKPKGRWKPPYNKQAAQTPPGQTKTP